MDRFVTIRVNYDKRIEKNLCNNNTALIEFAHDFRQAVNSCGISCLCTYRAVKRLNKFVDYMSKAEAIDIGLTKGLAADDIRMVYNKLKKQDNEWAVALKAVSDL